jgi:GMP reductase
MDTVGTYEVYKVLSQHKMITCFHKFYTTDDYLQMDLNPDYFCITIGLNEIEKLQEICNTIEVKFICIDVANGYMDKLIEVNRSV